MSCSTCLVMRAPKGLHVDSLQEKTTIELEKRNTFELQEKKKGKEEEPECQGLQVKVKVKSVDSSSSQRQQ